jgi:hypothetical protein
MVRDKATACQLSLCVDRLSTADIDEGMPEWNVLARTDSYLKAIGQ